tara:strand:- start:319 stop:957 length:639 start_codon:yes stop_codon:yes gene_type:complete
MNFPIEQIAEQIARADAELRQDHERRQVARVRANQDWINTFTKDLLRLKKSDQKIFIETGSANGDGIEAALQAGFAKIYSIELNEYFAERCRKRFEGKPVEIIEGSSCDKLPSILKAVKDPFFLWLDAHYSTGPYIGEKMDVYLPKELAVIASLEINFENCSICMDDINHYIEDNDFIRLLKVLTRLIKQNAEPQFYQSVGAGDHIFLTSIH